MNKTLRIITFGNERKILIPIMFSMIICICAYSNAQCVPLTTDDVLILEKHISLNYAGEPTYDLNLRLSDDFSGKLWLNDTDSNSSFITATLKDTIVTLTPVISKDRRNCRLQSEQPIIQDKLLQINIPGGTFEISPDYVEVDRIDLDENLLESFSVAGAWHKKGTPWTHQGMFSIVDDDSLDGQIKSSSQYGSYGYFSLMYPLLESLGLRGNVAGEGRRMGLSDIPPAPNDNFRTLVRLQNEKGWEILSHSMICLGEILNNWKVDSLDSELANTILIEGPNNGEDASTISIYDLRTKKQYWPNADNSAWTETPSRFIKPYIGDYQTKQVILFNPDYDFDWHWGEWERTAREFGLNPTGFVTHNSTSSHLLVPGIMKYFPLGFSDLSTLNINTPPLLSSAVRVGLEGQSLKGYAGEGQDNLFNEEHFQAFRNQIDEAAECGGWIMFNLHAYRKCWKNSLPGALVSEGGSYPDAWAIPMKGIDSANDPYSPPAKLGIQDWSEWYPCPGTRLHMMWQLLKYAKEKGLINVTSSQGFDIMGNKKAFGYFSNGHKIGQDGKPSIGIRERYPHYIVAATDETYYYNPIISDTMVFEMNSQSVIDNICATTTGRLIKSGRHVRWISSSLTDVELRVIDTIGNTVLTVESDYVSLHDLPKGTYIVCVFHDNRFIKSIKTVV